MTVECSNAGVFGQATSVFDTDNVVPMSNPHDMQQRLRPDAVTRQNEREALMASAPVQDQGYFLVPKVID